MLRTVLTSSMLLLGCLGCGGVADDHRRPDVVLVVLDTLRADVLSFYGAAEERAPFLARLAEEGTVFEKAFSTSTWTAPATASVLTGAYPDRHGVTRGFLAQFREGEAVEEDELRELELLAISSDVPTLAERLKELGYRTVGLASNVNIGPEMEFDRGFDRFERHDRQPAKFLRERLIEIQQEAEDRPTFYYLHFNDVHKPYELRPRYYRVEEGRDETEEYRERYQSELGYLDAFLGRIQQAMAWGPDTLIVVVADHGEEFREHGQLYHEFTLYVELNRVPFLVHAPGLGVKPGRVAENVSLIDVAPTLLELLGVEVAGEVDGRSLAAFCRSADKASGLSAESSSLVARPLILHRFEDDEHLWGIILQDWKLIRSDHRTLLFNLREDPSEQRNIAAEHPSMVERLEALLEEHRQRGMNPRSKRVDQEIDEELLERLRSLGYVK